MGGWVVLTISLGVFSRISKGAAVMSLNEQTMQYDVPM